MSLLLLPVTHTGVSSNTFHWQRYIALDLKLCIVRLGLAKQAIKHAWMARWERESVEVVITLCVVEWSPVDTLGDVNKTKTCMRN